MKLKNLIVLVLAIIALSFFVGRMTLLKEKRSLNVAVSHLQNSVSRRDVLVGNLRVIVWEKDQLSLTKDQAISLGLLEQDRLKALNYRKASYITKISANLDAARDSIRPDSLTVIVYDTITVPGDTIAYAKLPISFDYEREYINLSSGFDKAGLGWFDLKAPSPLTITLGDRKTGLWKSTPSVSVSSPSPYLLITNLETVNLQKKYFYERPLVSGGIGLGLGVLIMGVFGN